METFDALHAFRSFRDSFYESLERRADALFELTDALLTAEAVPSPVHLSLQASHRRGWGSLYAVDVSVWPRCDAECSPERGFYYHPSRHSSAQLNFVRESWTAPVDVERVHPARDANEVAAEQIKAFLLRSPEEGEKFAPMFVFDAGYDPVKLHRGLKRVACARSSCACAPGVASTAIRASPTRPRTPVDHAVMGRR
jgi:hypothetical protein